MKTEFFYFYIFIIAEIYRIIYSSAWTVEYTNSDYHYYNNYNWNNIILYSYIQYPLCSTRGTIHKYALRLFTSDLKNRRTEHFARTIYLTANHRQGFGGGGGGGLDPSPKKGPPTAPRRRKRSAEHTWRRRYFTTYTERARYTNIIYNNMYKIEYGNGAYFVATPCKQSTAVDGRRRRVRFLFFISSPVVTYFSEKKRKFKYFNDGDHIHDHRHHHPTFIYIDTKVIHLTILSI